MQNLRFLLRIIDGISEWTGKVTSFTITLLIVAIVWDVVLRYVFNSRPLWGIGAYGKLSAAFIILGAAYTLLAKAHINVDILYRRFPIRIRAITDLVTSALLFLFCLALLWQAVERSLGISFSFGLFLPPYWPMGLIASIGVTLFLLQGLAKFVRDLIIAITGKEIA